ncbi:glycerate kinase [Gracilibacillus sp. HCP3S3_G5_1]|uniref:glycerate kinase n=1 Tax=unclassified Gracilibacillus TaxID=2625209 RepID=UPI003F8C7964
MKILVSPDSFKESMTASKVANIMREAIMSVKPDSEVVKLPVADGGEGTLDALLLAHGGEVYYQQVTGPLGERVKARYGILQDSKTAVIEMAEASGIHLVTKERRNPLFATSYGTGELILAALDHQITNLIITIGGSATNDGGIGMLQALGASITNKNGESIGVGGKSLGDIHQFDLTTIDNRITNVTISVACDVNNPLTGTNGASYVFGPQKGATSSMMKLLDHNLEHLNRVMYEQLGKNLGEIPGSGAAGGMGAALLAIGATLRSGIKLVLDTISFSEKIANVDYIFTGEGKIDHQTPNGKVVSGITDIANESNIPVIAFAGTVGSGYESLYEKGLLSVHSIMQNPCSLEEAFYNAENNLKQTVENVTRLL